MFIWSAFVKIRLTFKQEKFAFGNLQYFSCTLFKMNLCFLCLVRIMIRSQFDLRSSLELVRYHRPIRIFRRTRDAIMAHPPGEIATNRANMLLADVLLQRHPILMNNALAFAALTEWLSVPHIRGSTSILRKFYFYNTVMVTHFV